MKKKISKEQRAWDSFKALTFNAAMVSFGCGGLAILFVRDFYPALLLILIAPISYFFAWKYFTKEFLKEGIKP